MRQSTIIAGGQSDLFSSPELISRGVEEVSHVDLVSIMLSLLLRVTQVGFLVGEVVA